MHRRPSLVDSPRHLTNDIRGPAQHVVRREPQHQPAGRQLRPRNIAALPYYQSLIPGVVDASGPEVHLVDQSTVGGADIYDWTRPNDFGYARMAYNWYTALDAVIGGGAWKPVVSPYRIKKAAICQIHYGAGGRRGCQVRPVN